MGCRHTKNTDENLGIVAQRIKKLRETADETQDKLAKAINVSKNMIANIEQSKSAPSLETAKNIAEHYGVSVDYICGLSEDMALPSSTLDTLCRYISIDMYDISTSQSHAIPVISIRKCFFEYLNVLIRAKQLKKDGVPDEVLDAWLEKEAEKAKNLLRIESTDNSTVEYALLTNRYIALDDVQRLLERSFNESSGDDKPL